MPSKPRTSPTGIDARLSPLATSVTDPYTELLKNSIFKVRTPYALQNHVEKQKKGKYKLMDRIMKLGLTNAQLPKIFKPYHALQAKKLETHVEFKEQISRLNQLQLQLILLNLTRDQKQDYMHVTEYYQSHPHQAQYLLHAKYHTSMIQVPEPVRSLPAHFRQVFHIFVKKPENIHIIMEILTVSDEKIPELRDYLERAIANQDKMIQHHSKSQNQDLRQYSDVYTRTCLQNQKKLSEQLQEIKSLKPDLGKLQNIYHDADLDPILKSTYPSSNKFEPSELSENWGQYTDIENQPQSLMNVEIPAIRFTLPGTLMNVEIPAIRFTLPGTQTLEATKFCLPFLLHNVCRNEQTEIVCRIEQTELVSDNDQMPLCAKRYGF